MQNDNPVFGGKSKGDGSVELSRRLQRAVADLCSELQNANDFVLGHKKGSDLGHGPSGSGSSGPSA